MSIWRIRMCLISTVPGWTSGLRASEETLPRKKPANSVTRLTKKSKMVTTDRRLDKNMKNQRCCALHKRPHVEAALCKHEQFAGKLDFAGHYDATQRVVHLFAANELLSCLILELPFTAPDALWSWALTGKWHAFL
jgi:hypothetical protein